MVAVIKANGATTVHFQEETLFYFICLNLNIFCFVLSTRLVNSSFNPLDMHEGYQYLNSVLGNCKRWK